MSDVTFTTATVPMIQKMRWEATDHICSVGGKLYRRGFLEWTDGTKVLAAYVCECCGTDATKELLRQEVVEQIDHATFEEFIFGVER